PAPARDVEGTARDRGEPFLDQRALAVHESGELGAVLARAAGDRRDVVLVVLAQVGGVGARHRPLLAHPRDGHRGVEAAGEGDPDTFTNREGSQYLGHVPHPRTSFAPSTTRLHGRGHRDGPVTVVAHRGASGYRPEHTRASYELAVELGADFIEPDLVMTRDGVLVDRHEPDVSETTDIADHPELSERRRTKLVDGQPVTGWFTEDLTLTELRTLRARERLPELRSSEYDDRFGVLTFEACLQLRETLSDEAGRPIGIMPEVKHPTYLHDHGLDAATELVRLLRAHGLDDPQAPVWVQCFEPTFLAELRRRHGLGVATVLLTEAEGGPWDLRARSTTYEGLLAPEGLAELARSV